MSEEWVISFVSSGIPQHNAEKTKGDKIFVKGLNRIENDGLESA